MIQRKESIKQLMTNNKTEYLKKIEKHRETKKTIQSFTNKISNSFTRWKSGFVSLTSIKNRLELYC